MMMTCIKYVPKTHEYFLFPSIVSINRPFSTINLLGVPCSMHQIISENNNFHVKIEFFFIKEFFFFF